MKKLKSWVCLSWITIFILVSSSSLYGTPLLTTEKASMTIEEVMELIQNSYVGEEVSIQQLLDGALKGIFNTLDEYSTYYTEEEYEEFIENITGEFGGIGIEMRKYPDYLEVLQVFSNTPAEKAGIQVGDYIEEINGVSIKDWELEKVANEIKGPIDTEVVLTLRRWNQHLKVTLRRAAIQVNPITILPLAELLPKNKQSDDVLPFLLYVKISQFNGQTIDAFLEVQKQIEEHKIKGILFDVRDNPGGALDQVVGVCEKIVPKGPIVHMVTKDGTKSTAYSSLFETPMPMVVLVNGSSASAAEIFASALQDSDAGKLVGQNTFGKGIVQRLYSTSYGGHFKMTTEEYLTRNGRHIHKKGLQPDVEVIVPDIIHPITAKWDLGHEGKDVVQIKEMLEFLGYSISNRTDQYDEATKKEVIKFQQQYGLYPYGVADLTTQDTMNKAVIKKIQLEDVQLKKGYEVLRDWVKEGK